MQATAGYSGKDAEKAIRTMYELSRIVERHTDLEGYDRQVELPIVDAAARPELAVAAFDQVAALFDQHKGTGSSNDD